MHRKLTITVGIILAAIAVVFLFSSGEQEITNMPPGQGPIVAFGDSLVEGVGSDRGGGFVTMLSERLDREIINLGVAGDTTADGLRRLEAARAHDPAVVLVLFGGNDAMRRTPVSETRGNLTAIIRELHQSGAVVVLLGVRGGLLGDPYDEMYEALSEELGTAYVPNVLKDILLRPELTHDQLHPNDKGYAIVADRVEAVLRPILMRGGE